MQMTTTKSLPGFESPAAGFDEPFEMLDACHDRLRRSLELLERLQRYLLTHAVDEQARRRRSTSCATSPSLRPCITRTRRGTLFPCCAIPGRRTWRTPPVS